MYTVSEIFEAQRRSCPECGLYVRSRAPPLIISKKGDHVLRKIDDVVRVLTIFTAVGTAVYSACRR